MTDAVQVRVNDRWNLWVPAHRAGHWERNPTWEPERITSMAANIKPGDVVYDIGAEQGDISALLATWAAAPVEYVPNVAEPSTAGPAGLMLPSGGGVVLVEPAPWYWPTIRATFEANQLPPPFASHCGFAADDIDIKTAADIGAWPPEAYEPMTGREAFQSVKGASTRRITIDALASWSQHPPTAITMDIEGAEVLAIRGAQQTLAEHRPLVWVSVHAEAMFNDWGVYQAEFHSLFHQHGYEKCFLGFDHELHVFYFPGERRDTVVLPEGPCVS